MSEELGNDMLSHKQLTLEFFKMALNRSESLYNLSDSQMTNAWNAASFFLRKYKEMEEEAEMHGHDVS